MQLLTQLLGPVLNFLGKILGVFMIHRQGKKDQEADAMREELEDIREAKKIKDSVGGMSDDELDEWVYGPKE